MSINEENMIEYEDDSLILNEKNEVGPCKASTELDKKIKNDFDFARKNIKQIIDTGMEAAENLSSLASQSEHPRIYECLSNLLQINSVNNTMLLDLDQKMKDLAEGKENGGDSNGGGSTHNNTLIVASTTEIQRMIEEKIKGSK